MTRYSCGFLFDNTLTLVVLIEKNRPEWMRGLYNGVGGHIEEGETPLEAMKREFSEEAGLEIDSWIPYCILTSDKSEINFFYSIIDGEEIAKVRTLTDEEVGIFSIEQVKVSALPIVPNLAWDIPMALMSLNQKGKLYNITIKDIDGT